MIADSKLQFCIKQKHVYLLNI